jgi:hypothetical protein
VIGLVDRRGMSGPFCVSPEGRVRVGNWNVDIVGTNYFDSRFHPLNHNHHGPFLQISLPERPPSPRRH